MAREWVDPNPGLIDYVQSRHIIVPWAERRAFLRDERNADALAKTVETSGYPGPQHPVTMAVEAVLDAASDPEVYLHRGILHYHLDALQRIAARANIDPPQHPSGYTDRHGHQLRFVEPGRTGSFEIAIEEAYRGQFEDRDPLGTIDNTTLTDQIVGVMLATQAYLFAADCPPTRVATRILVYPNDMSFEGYLVEASEPEMLIGSNQPAVVEALSSLLIRSGCFVLD